jgi:predicted DNA-binding transcriptional regulator AlpA
MQIEKLTLTAKEICALCGFSRSTFSKLRKLKVFTPLFGLRRNEKFSRESVLLWVSGQNPKKDAQP